MDHEQIIINNAQRAWLLPVTMHKLMKDFRGCGTEMELNRTQARILAITNDHPKMTASRLHRITALEKGSLTPILRKLEENGLIRRTTDPEDKRRQLISLTNKGINVNSELKERAAHHIRRKLIKLQPETMQKLNSALNILEDIARQLDENEDKHEPTK